VSTALARKARKQVSGDMKRYRLDDVDPVHCGPVHRLELSLPVPRQNAPPWALQRSPRETLRTDSWREPAAKVSSV
jgi:hypothetical protein